ncbi:MAG TPA: Asp-tRNA(Asn)/Glu-tRNA(Gln) amidotransferase subunit GatA, partial [Clostridiaceae bacterium]|nr:Asp-tRNA(Asn)/Glu-tRNA(Gln) amidotransferase subunit GatA [Clostridiaceae bacterium]
MKELNLFTAHELSDLIKNRDIKAEEVAAAHFDRIDSVDSKVGAYLYLAKAEALEKARELDRKI